MSGEVPEGYLGTDGRITSGPAPELVAAGYALELSDAPTLHEGLLDADLAHVLHLEERGLLDSEVTAALLRALLDLGSIPAADFPYDVTLGDAYNSRERELERRVGRTAGFVHLGRTRREAGRIAFRMALRERLEALAAEVSGLGLAIADRAEEHAGTVWADVTYLQLAQPSTFGHYLAAFAEETSRHLPRLRHAYEWADTSPAGSGGVAGTGLALDRQRLAEILGFSRVGRNTRDTMWTIDGLIDAVTAASQAATTCDRLAEDLQIFASAGFGLVKVDASLCRASVLMPQKRNPYALSVIRAGASTLVGRLAGIAATARTPSASTDNWLHSYGEVVSAVELACRIVALTSAVVRTLQIDAARMARSAADDQALATDLAERLVVEAGLDYRTAYRVVGRAVSVALDTATPITPEAVQAAADAVLGSGHGLATVNVVLPEPVALVSSRVESGGCAPESVRAELAALRPELSTQAAWFLERSASSAAARRALRERAARVASRTR